MRPASVKRVDWLLAGTVAGTIGLVLAVLVGFDVLLALSEELGDLGTGDYTLTKALIYVAYTVPRRIHELFGSSALIGTLIGLGLLAGNGEITALRAAGLSKLRIALSATVTVAALGLAVSAMGETLAPEGERWAQRLSVQAKHHDYALAQGSGMWARDGEAVINAKRAFVNPDRELELREIRLYFFDDEGRLSRIMRSESGIFREDAWQLDDVRQFTFEPDRIHATQFPTSTWASNLDPEVLSLGAIRPRYLGVAGLLENYRYNKASGLNTQALESAFWARVFNPLSTLALVFAITPFAFGTLRSGGLGKRVFLGIIIAVAFYFIQRALINLADVYGYSLPLINAMPALLLTAIGWLYYRRNA
ncbi:MAG: LPS export ABC transporter permease LptG [Xanthomonadales bacterium]|nr:LPS export ABC transporter permease LptG [Xanthomonadales bacterium]